RVMRREMERHALATRRRVAQWLAVDAQLGAFDIEIKPVHRAAPLHFGDGALDHIAVGMRLERERVRPYAQHARLALARLAQARDLQDARAESHPRLAARLVAALHRPAQEVG